MIPGRCVKCRRRSRFAQGIYSAHCARCLQRYEVDAPDPKKAFLGMLIVAAACFLVGLAVMIVRG